MNKLLLRQEYKDTYKGIYIEMLVIVVINIVAILIASQGILGQNDARSTTAVMVTSCCNVCILVLVGLVMADRYANILFKNKGYIAMSIPVKNSSHLKANFMMASIWLILVAFVIIASSSIMDLFVDEEYTIFGIIFEIEQDLMHYYGNVALVIGIIISYILAMIVFLANLYITVLAAFTLSHLVINKFNIVQKEGLVILVTLLTCGLKIALYGLSINIFDIISNKVIDLLFSASYTSSSGSFIIIDFLIEISGAVFVIVVYGITTLLMYKFCEWAINKKYSI